MSLSPSQSDLIPFTKIHRLIEKSLYFEALDLINLQKSSNKTQIELLKLKAHIYKCLNKMDEYITTLETMVSLSNNMEDQEYFIYELSQFNQQERAYQLKIEQLQQKTYCQKISQYLKKGHPLFVSNHKFMRQFARHRLQNKLNDLAKACISEVNSLARAEWFIKHLFNLNAFYQTSDPILHRPSYIAYAHLNNQPFIEDNKIITRKRFSSIHNKIIECVMQLIKENTLAPYVKEGEGTPTCLDHLKGNLDWSSLVICTNGISKVKQGDTLISLLKDNFDLAEISPMAPEVMISILKPGTHIKPHFGLSNIKQTLHIPIVIPEGDLGIKVANEKKVWPRDFPILFDDSFQHEAWNFSDETRIVLIVDIWHPDLTSEEKQFLTQSYPLICQCFAILTQSTQLQQPI